ncbi:MAG: tRNA glutamyl-Q synthetase [Sphingobacteriales bacterium]|nr:MAG: tRNA glutamyl-Q synthetase [Sphingobacteriales bacterium]
MQRFRLAPTPSGFLHRGNLFNFLLTEKRCWEAGGQLRLRIDDLDAARVRPQYLQHLFEVLPEAGIAWQDGPHTVAEQETQYRQALRLPQYQAILQTLATSGNLFACRCSRTQLARESVKGCYSGRCLRLNLPLDAPDVAWRVDTQAAATVVLHERRSGTLEADIHRVNPFFIVRRRDGLPAYQVASLSDDLEYGITQIVRGKDLLQSSFSQLFLARLLGERSFEAILFEHHDLLQRPDGEKLSKTAGDRLQSYDPSELLLQVAVLRQQVERMS